jgi:hypothetical protein
MELLNGHHIARHSFSTVYDLTSRSGSTSMTIVSEQLSPLLLVRSWAFSINNSVNYSAPYEAKHRIGAKQG